jgi:hypothetical protein
MAADSTDFVIDMTANLDGGESAAHQLDQLANRFGGIESASEQLDAAMKRVSSALEQTGAAATSSAQAFADGAAAYKQSEKGADRAASAADKLAQRLEAARAKQEQLANSGDSVKISAYRRASAAVDKLAERHGEAKSKADAMTAALKTEAQALDKLKAKAEAAASAHDRMGKTSGKIEALAGAAKKASAASKLAGKGSGNLGDLATGLGSLGGPLGSTGSSAASAAEGMTKLGSSLGGTAAVAVGAAAVIVALVVVVVAATAAFAKLAVTQADAARSSKLATETLAIQHKALAGLGAALPAVQRQTGLSTERLQALATSLAEAGVTAKDLPNALKAAATAEAALGESGSAKIVEQLKAGKKSAAELATEMDQKFGKVVAKKMLSLSSLSTRFGQNLQSIFDGVDLEPFLSALGRVVDLFDTSTASGKFLQRVLGGAAQALVDVMVPAINAVVRTFLKLEIAVLRTELAILRLRELLNTGEHSGSGLQGPITTFDNMSASAALAQGNVAALAVAASQASGQMQKETAGFSGIGANMMAGLAEGITSNAGAVAAAITGAVGGAITAAKQLLDIKSPSKVFAKMGEQTAQGFAGGVDDAAPQARNALEGLVEPPPAEASGAAGGNGGGVSLEGVTFVFHGVKDAAAAEAPMRKLFVQLLEGDLAALGAEAVPG